MTEKIDFVVLWVDGADPQWRKEWGMYLPEEMNNGSSENRYRDWDLMRFWFRGIEAFAPWVNRVFFVTNGQKPAWLNTDHPKLRMITHREYIPEAYLPTFNSNVIELWLHNIPDLSEHFVLFNDDMFLTAPVTPEDFFEDGLPRDTALMDIVTAPYPEDCLPHILINNFSILNRHFNKKDVLKQNRRKFLTLKYKIDVIRNLCLIPFRYFSCFRDTHLPSSYLKSTFQQVWKKEGHELETSGKNRFRSKSDYSHWLMKCWQICEGNFTVRGTSWGHHFELWEDDIDTICKAIENQKYRAICLNDSKEQIAFEEIKKRLHQSFLSVFPIPSAYEQKEPEPKE